MVDTATEIDPPGTTPEDTAQKWNVKYNTARLARMNFERKWYTYLAFVQGKQYISWSFADSPLTLGRIIEPINPSNRVRIVINRTRKIMRKELAKINKEQVRGFVTPSSTDANSVSSSRAAEQIAKYLTIQLTLARVFKQADWWMLLCGTSFIKDYYDDHITFGVMKQQQFDPMTGQPVDSVTVPAKGGPVVEVVSPFHILVPNLDEPDIQKQEWVMHISMKTTDWVKERFNVDVGEGVSVASDTIESKLMNIQGMTSENSRARAVEVREIWIKPCLKYPKGGRITCTQDRILETLDEFPYEHTEYPFTKRTYIENSIFYGVTLIEDLLPVQVEYNRTRSQIVEDKNRMGRPQLAIEQGSVIGGTKTIKGVAGDIIEYRMGSRVPEPIPIAGLPTYIIDHVNRLRQEMDELASQEGNDSNNLPSGITAATAIAYLQENQDALIMDTLRDKEIAWQSVLRHLLGYIGQYWDGQRLVTVSGENGTFESFLFGKSDLSGQTNWTAVVGSATPQSYSAKQAQIMELMKGGFVPVAEGLQYLELGDTARLYEGLQVDKREAEKENIRMRNGVYVKVELWQEHLEHIICHDNVRKREEYEAWDQNSQAMIKYHTTLHMIQFINETAPNLMQQIQPLMPPEWTQAAMSGQIPQVPEALELALRGAINMLTMAPAPGGPAPGGPPPTTPEAY